MTSQDPGTSFAEWKAAAKGLLARRIPPAEVLWEREAGLFGAETALPEAPGQAPAVSVPKPFVSLARTVLCHHAPERWGLLYRILWRITMDGERSLCAVSSDRDMAKARLMEKAVAREIHKMHAFVRFKLVGAEGGTERERYVAWFEPDHFIVEAAAPFFRKRFANMDWSIFTPKGCAHWDGEQLVLTKGVEKDPTGDPDALETAWRTYYKSIFNPARLKTKAMVAEMPKRYWKNLPEADLIDELVEESRARVADMQAEDLRPAKPAPRNRYLRKLADLSATPGCSGPVAGQGLGELRASAAQCRACPLWKEATGTVFGTGPADARIMIVGEQPGDQEDIAGEPFVGPAGQLLRAQLAEAGIDAEEIYFTNAVKHFKWTPKDTPRGKIRLHQAPQAGEIEACRPWVLAELQRLAPAVLILLGATAGRSLLGRPVAVTKERGLAHAPHLAPRVVLTVHPSHLLRLPVGEREAARRAFRDDLALGLTRAGP